MEWKEFLKPDWKKPIVFILFMSIVVIFIHLNPCKGITDEPCAINVLFQPQEFIYFYYIDLILLYPYLMVITPFYHGISSMLLLLIPLTIIAYIHTSIIIFIIDCFKNSFRINWKYIKIIIKLILLFAFFTLIITVLGFSFPRFSIVISWIIWSLIPALSVLFFGIGAVYCLGLLTRRLKHPNLEFIIILLVLLILYFYIRISILGFVPAWGLYD